MKTKPILFNTEMVQAILEGRKTQTRRVIKPQPEEVKDQDGITHLWIPGIGALDEFIFSKEKMKVKKSDIFWVRETFADMGKNGFLHKANLLTQDLEVKWKPSIFMPKEACRIWLKVTDVRFERLQDISTPDAIAEGVNHYWNDLFQEERYKDYSKAKPGCFKPQRFYKEENNTLGEWREAKSSFFSLWESINGKASLEANPWVWVYTFKLCEMPKNFLS